MTPARPIVYAHRGASLEYPENTMPAFARAVELGVDALETDVHLTRDGVIVVHHDRDGRRMANDPARVAELTYDQLRRWDVGWGLRRDGARVHARQGFEIPRLDALLEAFPAMRLNVDMKATDPSLPQRLHRLLRDLCAVDRVQVASFHRAQLSRLRRDGFAGVTSLSQSEAMALLSMPLALLPALLGAGRRAQLPVQLGPLSLATPYVLQRCRQLGFPVDYFTVNDRERAHELARLGVDGVMTDNPRLIVPAICDLVAG